jgi:hypothetical protein
MNNADDFLPLGRVTGVGSLPHHDARSSIAFVARHCPEVPFWPQLPQRSPQEGMVDQALIPFMDLLTRRNHGGYGFCIRPGQRANLVRRLEEADPALDVHRAAGFFEFEKAMERDEFPYASALKGQVIGPYTLAWQLFDADSPAAVALEDASQTDGGALQHALGWYITRMALWQIERLERFDLPVLLCLDEPCLYLLPPQAINDSACPLYAMLEEVRTALTLIRAASASGGIHCCARLPGMAIRLTKPDFISFDAHANLESFCADPDAQAFMREGGLTAFGLIPTLEDLSTLNAMNLVSRWLLACTNIADISDIAAFSLVTATCGLGLLDEEAAAMSFEAARRVSMALRRIAEAPNHPTRSNSIHRQGDAEA